jgi:hypothetical protein
MLLLFCCCVRGAAFKSLLTLHNIAFVKIGLKCYFSAINPIINYKADLKQQKLECHDFTKASMLAVTQVSL